MTNTTPLSPLPLNFAGAISTIAPAPIAQPREGAGDFDALIRSQLPAVATAEISGLEPDIGGNSATPQVGETASAGASGDVDTGEQKRESLPIEGKDAPPTVASEPLNSPINPINPINPAQATDSALLSGYTMQSGIAPNIALVSEAKAVQSSAPDALSAAPRKMSRPLVTRSASRTPYPPSDLLRSITNQRQSLPMSSEQFVGAQLTQLASGAVMSHSEAENGDGGGALSTDLPLTVGQADFTLVAKMALPSAHEPGALEMSSPPLLDLDSGDAWIDQLSNDIRQLSENDGQLRFHLAPKSLGMLQVTIEREQSVLRVQMLVETASAHEKLAASGAQIIADARANGVTISDVTISNARPDDMAQNHSSHNSPRGGAQPPMAPRHRPIHTSGHSDESMSRVEKSTSDRFA